MTLSLPSPLTARFAFMMRALREAVAARIKCPPVTAGIIVFVCARLARIARDFERLADEIRAGTYAPRPAGRRRAGGAGPRRGMSAMLLHWQLGLPPWAPAWLHRVAPGDAGVWAGALRQLLSEPEMAAVIAAVPRMGRILRPLCFMLGVETRLLTPASAPPVSAPVHSHINSGATPFPGTGSGDRAWAAMAPDGTPSAQQVRKPDTPGAIFYPA